MRRSEYIAAVDPEIRGLIEESLDEAFAGGKDGRSRRKSMQLRDRAMCMIGKLIIEHEREINALLAKEAGKK